VNWAVVSRLTMAIGLVSVACCLAQIWLGSGHQQLGEFSSDSVVQIAARLFGLMQLLSTFTVWMVSHRLANYQRPNLFPKDWVSLTLTAWLGLMAFVVIASLPTEWPWLTLIK
jgi:hypothetical protein